MISIFTECLDLTAISCPRAINCLEMSHARKIVHNFEFAKLLLCLTLSSLEFFIDLTLCLVDNNFLVRNNLTTPSLILFLTKL